jgi:hypothetical protein
MVRVVEKMVLGFMLMLGVVGLIVVIGFMVMGKMDYSEFNYINLNGE